MLASASGVVYAGIVQEFPHQMLNILFPPAPPRLFRDADQNVPLKLIPPSKHRVTPKLIEVRRDGGK